MKISQTKPILVTGATGYIAGWIVKQLLNQGHTVHAPIRDPENKAKIAHLEEMATNSSGTLQFFQANLLVEDSYQEAMEGCELVIHTASPFFFKVKDPKRDLVDPALLGTRNILDTVNQTESVKRVVLTSSAYGIYGDNIDAKHVPNHLLNETHWNTTSSLKHQPYAYSKVIAEKEAWKYMKEQKRWDLVVINPSWVVGPATNPHASFESKSTLIQLGDGTFKSGAPKMDLGAVDVRDVAAAHIRAGFTPEAYGRYIISAENTDFLAIGKLLAANFKGYPFPKKYAPKWLVWLIAPMAGLTREFVSRNANHPMKLDHSRGKKELDMRYIPNELSFKEFFQQMIDEKYI